LFKDFGRQNKAIPALRALQFAACLLRQLSRYYAAPELSALMDPGVDYLLPHSAAFQQFLAPWREGSGQPVEEVAGGSGQDHTINVTGKSSYRNACVILS